MIHVHVLVLWDAIKIQKELRIKKEDRFWNEMKEYRHLSSPRQAYLETWRLSCELALSVSICSCFLNDQQARVSRQVD